MSKNGITYKIVHKIWIFFKMIWSYLSYLPYYLYKPVLNKKNNNKEKIIVSFTTYPARLKCLLLVVGSIVRQTLKPNEIVLYLSKEQFENLNHPIFKSIQKQGVKINLIDDDLRSHKKYFYAMQEYENDIIITIDDDIIYDRHLIRDLYKSYLRHPNAVSARRVHKIKFGENKKVLPYSKWDYDTKELRDIESTKLVATGCGGILYPPHVLHKDWKDIEGIKKTCICADDLWLKIMEILNNKPVVLAKSKNYKLKHVWGTNLNGLAVNNVQKDGNDTQLKKICEYKKINLYELLENHKN